MINDVSLMKHNFKSYVIFITIVSAGQKKQKLEFIQTNSIYCSPFFFFLAAGPTTHLEYITVPVTNKLSRSNNQDVHDADLLPTKRFSVL